MTLDYYRIFYYVAKYKSFSKAARMLDNNQPNITRCMNILESELDCKLLNRSHKGITLTPEGNTLYSHVSIAMKTPRMLLSKARVFQAVPYVSA